MAEPRVLVTGATGGVGGAVLTRLRRAGVAVSALTRGAPDFPAGVQGVRGDRGDPESLLRALDRVESVFLVWPFLNADGAADVVEVISERARRVVYLSSAGVSRAVRGEVDPITGVHTKLERLVESSGQEFVALRPTGFASNTIAWADEIRSRSVVRAPLRQLARPLIHEDDIAAVAIEALLTDALLGTRPVITG